MTLLQRGGREYREYPFELTSRLFIAGKVEIYHFRIKSRVPEHVGRWCSQRLSHSVSESGARNVLPSVAYYESYGLILFSIFFSINSSAKGGY